METMDNTYRAFYMRILLFKNSVILPMDEDAGIPVHPNCHCELNTNIAIAAGNATKDGKNGADYWLKHYGNCPTTIFHARNI